MLTLQANHREGNCYRNVTTNGGLWKTAGDSYRVPREWRREVEVQVVGMLARGTNPQGKV